MAETIPLQEYQTHELPKHRLSIELGRLIRQRYSSQIAIDAPSIFESETWRLTNQGWAGQIPLTDELYLVLEPKVSILNLFGMLEYAYRLKSFRFLQGQVQTGSLSEFYEELANILARRILDRARKGFYRTYLLEQDQLPYVRGRMDMGHVARSPWKSRIHCHYEEHTADVDENQILAWTLWRIAHSGNCTERVLPTVRKALRVLQGVASVRAFTPDDCLKGVYHRLNQDYQPLHVLSRFFLAQSGPSHQSGDKEMIPFLVDMAHLYELFVAEWLKAHVASPWRIRSQVALKFGEHSQYFQPDLIIEDAHSGAPFSVLDTKYKAPERPSSDDVAKIIAYAQTLGCYEAILIYPTPLRFSLNYYAGDIHVRTMTFRLDGNLENAGQAFLAALGLAPHS